MREQDARPWSAAWADASYGDQGFWTHGPGARRGPRSHFRTSAHAGDVLADALARLLDEVDRRLGRPERLDLVDVGAGETTLLSAVLDRAPEPARVRAVAVDVRPGPDGTDPRVRWVRGAVPGSVPAPVTGLLVAHELLDEIPLDVVELDDDGRRRLVLVDGTGAERLGPDLADLEACAALGVDARAATAWLDRWWPLTTAGQRAEVGQPRDAVWAALVSRVAAGTALAIDYGHSLPSRASHPRGTLTAYAEGRQVPAVPDGGVGITAHVAVDSLVADGGTVTDQRTALRALGADGALPDPAAPDYATALVHASHVAELLDPVGLGSWCWVRRDL